MSVPDLRFEEVQMLAIAANAVRKIDTGGRRATERLTYDEIEAMAITLLCLGLRPLSSTGDFTTPPTIAIAGNVTWPNSSHPLRRE